MTGQLHLICLVYVIGSARSSFPKMYRMHNYSECQPPNRTYCVFDFKLSQPEPGPLLFFDRSTLNRMYCIPSTANVTTYGLQEIAKELIGNWSGRIEIRDVQCEQTRTFPYLNTALLIFALGYFWLTFQATTTRRWGAFSLKKNIPKLWADNPNPDFQRLKAVQGVRVFNTALVVLFHSVYSLFRCYVTDVEELEKNFRQPIIKWLIFLGVFAVQIFFLISALLLTNQVYEVRRKHGRFSLGHCAILLLNRWCRFLPTVLLAVASTTSGLYDGSPHTIKIRNLCVENCRKNWWYAPLQITFLLDFDKICTPGLWYLSVDTLYYVATLAVLYLVLRFELNALRVFFSLAVASVVLFAGYLYWYRLKFMYQPYPEDLKYMVESEDMNRVYSPPIASWTSSLLGVILGYCYYHHKENPVILNKKWEVLGWFCFAAVPLTVVHWSMHFYEKSPWGAFIGALLKPLFVLPIGVGVLGFAFGSGGLLKSFLESRPLVILSNVTYCSYVYHFYIVFAKGLFTEDLVHYKSHHLYLWLVFDIVSSFGLGAFFTVLVEYPGLALQKLIIPQIGAPPKKD